MKQLSFRARSFIFNNKKNDKVSYMTQLGQSKATSQIVLKNIYSGVFWLCLWPSRPLSGNKG